MSATIAEKLGSGELQSGDTGHHEKLYLIRSETSEASAIGLLETTAPGTFGGLIRQTCRVSPVDGANDIWIGEVQYADPEEVEPDEGTTVFSFNTSGGSQHITQSISTSQKKAPTGKTAPDFKGAINATEKGSVDGVDIISPVYRWSETHVVASAKVTSTYKGYLFDLTGKTNNGTFDSFAAGEVLFEGASGSKRGDGAWEITYSFASSPNRTDLTIGAITGINKKGWEYLWVLYSDVADGGMLAKQPRAVYVEKVYEEGNFAKLNPDYTP
jgi:hypothetical protein